MAYKLTGQMPPRQKTASGNAKYRANKAQLISYIQAALASKVEAEAAEAAKSPKAAENIKRGMAKLGLAISTLTNVLISKKDTPCVGFPSSSKQGQFNYTSLDGKNCTCEGNKYRGCWHTAVAPILAKWLETLGLYASPEPVNYDEERYNWERMEAQMSAMDYGYVWNY
jgi:hypothetical protein